jgi:hypothetical protein
LTQRLNERPLPQHATHLSHWNDIHVTLTLHSIDARLAQTSGLPWITGRAFLPQGKDPATGQFRPAKWWTLKAYCLNDDPNDPVIELLSQLKAYLGKNYLVKLEVTGHTEYREWTATSGSGSEDVIVIETIPLFTIELRPS